MLRRDLHLAHQSGLVLGVVASKVVRVATNFDRVAPIRLERLPQVPDEAVGGLDTLQAPEQLLDLGRVDSDALWWLEAIVALSLRFTKWMECSCSLLLNLSWCLSYC